MNYSQCKLEREFSCGTVTMVTWLPSQFASVGRSLRLKEAGIWEDGWVVREVWQTLPEEQLPDSHAERKAHKRATGDVG